MLRCLRPAWKRTPGDWTMIGLAILAATGLAATQVSSPGCTGETTLELNACLGHQLDASENDLRRYVDAARERLISEAKSGGTSAAPALADFDRAEQMWLAYRKAECGAVYDYWITGTIRTSMELTCEIDLTRRHTRTVWSEWLTYMDDTP